MATTREKTIDFKDVKIKHAMTLTTKQHDDEWQATIDFNKQTYQATAHSEWLAVRTVTNMLFNRESL
jgi:hypothetical protein